MSRTGWTATAVAGVVLVAAAILNWATRSPAPAAAAAAPPAAPVTAVAGELLPGVAAASEADDAGAALRTMEVTLYFARADGEGLAPEVRSIYATAALLGRMKQSVVALIQGPAADSPLLPVLPPGTPLFDLYLDGKGTVYVDFGRELVRNLPPGVTSELLAANSLAHTLLGNFPGLQQVRLLIMGEEIRTLGGHLDLSRPLPADPALIRPLEPEVEEEQDEADQEDPHAET